MNEPVEYIEAYLNQVLNEAERRLFEERCEQDNNFAHEVALYVTTREAVRQKLLEQKKLEWVRMNADIPESMARRSVAVKNMARFKWLPYAAAACLIIALLIYFNASQPSPHQLANAYIQQNYTELSKNMDASADSIQQGIVAYNGGEYSKALHVFETYYRAHPDDSYAKQYIGLCYLMTNDYEKALYHFEELSQTGGLDRNPAFFLMALTRLERNTATDAEAARALLQRVVSEKMDHNAEAAALLKSWE